MSVSIREIGIDTNFQKRVFIAWHFFNATISKLNVISCKHDKLYRSNYKMSISNVHVLVPKKRGRKPKNVPIPEPDEATPAKGMRSFLNLIKASQPSQVVAPPTGHAMSPVKTIQQSSSSDCGKKDTSSNAQYNKNEQEQQKAYPPTIKGKSKKTLSKESVDDLCIKLTVPDMHFTKAATQLSYDALLFEPVPIDSDPTSVLAPLMTKSTDTLQGDFETVMCFNEQDTAQNIDKDSRYTASHNHANHTCQVKGQFNSNAMPKGDSNTFREIASFEEMYPQSTEVCCWWCTYPFLTRPIGLPKKFNEKEMTWYCTGCFCTFNCALAWSKTRHVSTVPLKQMYYQYTRKSDLTAAPEQSALDIFGGPLDINEFRYKSLLNAKYIEYKYPQVPLHIFREDICATSIGANMGSLGTMVPIPNGATARKTQSRKIPEAGLTTSANASTRYPKAPTMPSSSNQVQSFINMFNAPSR